MNIDNYREIRKSFGLNKAQAGKLVNLSSVAVSRVEEGQVPPFVQYRELWVELSETRAEYIHKGATSMPRSRFSGTERQWVARESAIGYLLSQTLASNAKKSYNPAFSAMNQPKG